MKVILTADQIQQRGLVLGRFDCRRQRGVRQAKNVVRFKRLYGSHPIVYAQIWEDLQKKAENKKEAAMNLDSFLMCVHFLKCYPTYEQLSGPFGMCEKTVQKWIWIYAKKIQALKTEKVITNCLALACICFFLFVHTFLIQSVGSLPVDCLA
jgi:hypothetical protein